MKEKKLKQDKELEINHDVNHDFLLNYVKSIFKNISLCYNRNISYYDKRGDIYASSSGVNKRAYCKSCSKDG